MSLPVTHDLTAYRGDSWYQEFRLKRDGLPVNLTNATVESEARPTRASKGLAVSLSIVIEDATDGRFKLALPEDGLPPATYAYDVEVREGTEVRTWIKGSLIVWRDVTNELP